MLTYPISRNFSKKIFSAMFSALQYSFLHCESRVFFYWRFLVYFVTTKKMKLKRENTQMDNLFDVRMDRFQRKFNRW